MNDTLGQFIRYLHYILIIFLQEETLRAKYYPGAKHTLKTLTKGQQEKKEEMENKYFDRQTFIQIVKVIQCLIIQTPYNLMKKGLITIMLDALVNNLYTLDRINNRDQLIRNELCVAINNALAKSDLIDEINKNLFSNQKLSETLFNTIFKVQNFISSEKI